MNIEMAHHLVGVGAAKVTGKQGGRITVGPDALAKYGIFCNGHGVTPCQGGPWARIRGGSPK